MDGVNYLQRDGVIRSIVVKNFLCHKYLKVDFEKSIKFIVGHNGSGKSAILDALILGLGGKAYNTHRYGQIKSYVQTGAEFASIQIKIKNDGPKAYKYNEYGRYITIIRDITHTGDSTYKVKSASDKVISNRRSAVDSILLAHNIQMDNPVSVLPQKVTKEFNDLSDDKKYLFYKRATNLALTEENYDKALEDCSKAKQILNIKKKTCEDYEDELRKWEKIMANINAKEKNRVEKMELDRELKWSTIRKWEYEVKKRERDFERKNEEWLRNDRKINRPLNIDDSSLNELKCKLKNEIDERTKLENEKKELDNKVSTNKRKLDDIQESKRKISNIIAREEEKIKKFNGQIQDIMSGSAAQRHQVAVERVEEARELVKETRARLDTAAVDAANADAECERARQLLHTAQANYQRLSEKLGRMSNKERELQRNAGPLSKYGAYATRLHERVLAAAAANRFRRRPLGPVGAYLSVRNEIWSSALEHILGHAIESYCVDNSQDYETLKAVIDEVYTDRREKRPDVTCCQFLEHPHPARGPPLPRGSAACCALSALEVDNPVVYNYLVDELALETILLVQTDEEAMQFCQREQNVPNNCRKVVTCECSEYFPAPRYRCYGSEARPVRFLHASAEAALRQLRAEHSECAAAREAAERDVRERREQCVQAQARRERERARVRDLHTSMQRHESELRRCENELQRTHAPQLQERQEEMNISQQRLQKARENKDKIEQQESELADKIKETLQELKDVKMQLNRVNNNIKNTDDSLEKMQSECNKKLSQIELKRKTHNDIKNILEEMKRKNQIEIPEKKRLIENLKNDVITQGSRIENPRPKHVLTALLQDKEAELSSFADEQYDQEHVRKELDIAREKYETISKYLEDLEQLIEEMTKTVDTHLRSCLLRLNTVSLHVQNNFKAILDMRRIQGQLHIDNVSKKLWFDQGGRQASGGERTFALVAFLVALQECVDLPFFFMDEFNVFLDGVNYKKAVELLLIAARKRPACQYVFITPNEPPGLRSDTDLDIQT
ncbi:unnamed protein product, partial [Brenthis ino]